MFLYAFPWFPCTVKSLIRDDFFLDPPPPPAPGAGSMKYSEPGLGPELALHSPAQARSCSCMQRIRYDICRCLYAICGVFIISYDKNPS